VKTAVQDSSTPQNTMNGEISTVKNDFEALPNYVTSQNDLIHLNATLTALRHTMTIQPDVAALQLSVTSLPDLTGIHSTPSRTTLQLI
jgi:hypothetical protein